MKNENNEAYIPLLHKTTIGDWLRAVLFGIAVPFGAYYLFGGLASILAILILAQLYVFVLKRETPTTYLLLFEAGAILMGTLVFGLIVALGIVASAIG